MSANTSATEVGTPPRPAVVDYAVYALIARCVFSLAAVFAFYGARDEVSRSLADANKNKHWSAATLHHNVDVWLRGNLISTLVTIVMVGIVIWFLREGRNWARLLYLVFAVLVIRDVFEVFGFFQYHNFPLRVLTGLVGLSSIAAIVLLFLPESNAYFRPASRGGGLLGSMFRPRATAALRNQPGNEPGNQPPADGQPAEPGLTEPYVAEHGLTEPYVANSGVVEQATPGTTASGAEAERATEDVPGERAPDDVVPAGQAPEDVPADRRPAPRGKSRQPGRRGGRR